MNHLVIDLEMCRVPKHYRTKDYKHPLEIIQIGAVLLDEEYEIIGKLNQYVHPEHGVVDYFITNLTGIENKQLKNAPCLKEALKHMIDWIGEREYKVYAWSNSDHKQLSHEINSKGLSNTSIDGFMSQDRWIDYQAVFGSRFDFNRAVSLEETLMYCNVSSEGRMHDGLDDAVNTAKVIKVLETDENFKLYECKEEFMGEMPTLNFSMGDLFTGLKIECFA